VDGRIRGTYESVTFAHQKEQLGLDPQRFDELLFAVTWVLAHDPARFPRVPCTSLLRIKTMPGAYGFPALVMYATIDDEDNCILQWIEESTEDPGSDDLTEFDLGG
jgi:hypothetical protein